MPTQKELDDALFAAIDAAKAGDISETEQDAAINAWFSSGFDPQGHGVGLLAGEIEPGSDAARTRALWVGAAIVGGLLLFSK